MKSKNYIIRIVILLVLFILFMKPEIFPLSQPAVRAVKAQLRDTFGGVGSGNGVFSRANLFTAGAVIALMGLIASIRGLVFSFFAKGKARSQTVAGLLGSIVRWICLIVAIVWVLAIFGVNLTGIFASLGLISLIIGFGAQSLIEDTITGIFIIAEGYYNIGDVIILDEFRGTVKKIGIRTTVIEDTGGNLKVVNNSDIRNIQNRSQNMSMAICDIGTPYDSDIREIEQVVMSALPDMYERNRGLFQSTPIYRGVQELGESAVVIRVTVDCMEKDYFVATRRLNREMKILFDDNGITVPFNQLDVHNV
ncbi:MAG: mechanosensitive ion channel family protein [Oscillospiraceae bacterium]|nr:mechanosensitive ion channel family protein [Oscillospiraceae bacterium]